MLQMFDQNAYRSARRARRMGMQRSGPRGALIAVQQRFGEQLDAELHRGVTWFITNLLCGTIGEEDEVVEYALGLALVYATALPLGRLPDDSAHPALIRAWHELACPVAQEREECAVLAFAPQLAAVLTTDIKLCAEIRTGPAHAAGPLVRRIVFTFFRVLRPELANDDRVSDSRRRSRCFS